MSVDFDTMKSFISKIGPLVQEYAKQNGYKVASPIIAQACLESGYGTSYKAKFHNYFGLKYRNNRCQSSSGSFTDYSSEQKPSGLNQWFKFDTMEDGVKGYFEFISAPNYDAIRQNISDPIKFVEILGQCNYYTSPTYVQNIKRIITINNLKQYDQEMYDKLDDINNLTSNIIEPVKGKKYYRVRISWGDFKNQIGAYEDFENAKEECDKHIAYGYHVFDSEGKLVYPLNNETETNFKIGDTIKLLTDIYYNGKKIPEKVQKATLYYRGKNNHGWKFSTKKSGSITGVVKEGMLVKI